MENIENKTEPQSEFKLFVFDFGTLGSVVTRGRNEEEAKTVMFHDLDRNSSMYGSTYHIIDVNSLPEETRTRIEFDYEKTHPDYKNTIPKILMK